MQHPQLIVSDENARDISCDALLLGATESGDGFTLTDAAANVDAALDGHIAQHLQSSGFKAKIGDVVTIPTMGRLPASVIAVVGLGRAQQLDAAVVRRASGAAARRISQHRDVASALHTAVTDTEATSATVEGLLLGSYRFTKYKSDPRPSKIQRISFLDGNVDGVERGRVFSAATVLARDLVNEPAQDLTPEMLARRAREVADVNGLECTVHDEEELQRNGFGGLLAVARGSHQPPRLIDLRYRTETSTGSVTLVGKGITFDSGGLSLKDARGMETMKTDMSGAAAVLGAMSGVAKLAPSVEVRALIPATENMPGGAALKPGDVIRHYGGRTSEVLNTDAEGRLILVDALALACEEKPDAIVDVATLTGAMVVALGQRATGFFSTDDELAAQLQEAAADAGERIWRMPLYDDYRSDIDSEIADIRNTGPRWGGAIIAALFLKDFVQGGIPWAHLDIAGPARAEGDRDEVVKGGSGVAARTLLRWLEMRSTGR